MKRYLQLRERFTHKLKLETDTTKATGKQKSALVWMYEIRQGMLENPTYICEEIIYD